MATAREQARRQRGRTSTGRWLRWAAGRYLPALEGAERDDAVDDAGQLGEAPVLPAQEDQD